MRLTNRSSATKHMPATTPIVPTVHAKARVERPKGCPPRVKVSDAQVLFSVAAPAYKPTYWVDKTVLAADYTKSAKGWADPETFALVKRRLESVEGPIRYGADGLPLNPHGRTGISGRGLLGKWGPNKAVDLIVAFVDPKTRDVKMLSIQRKDTREWATPGGFVDESQGETVEHAFARELYEETNVRVDARKAFTIYRGYCDDPRNTDNAWIETTVKVMLMSYDEAMKLEPKAKDDARKWSFKSIGKGAPALYASHTAFANAAVRALRDRRLVP